MYVAHLNIYYLRINKMWVIESVSHHQRINAPHDNRWMDVGATLEHLIRVSTLPEDSDSDSEALAVLCGHLRGVIYILMFY